MRDTVSICGTHELGFKRCARTRYAGRVVTLIQRYWQASAINIKMILSIAFPIYVLNYYYYYYCILLYIIVDYNEL